MAPEDGAALVTAIESLAERDARRERAARRRLAPAHATGTTTDQRRGRGGRVEHGAHHRPAAGGAGRPRPRPRHAAGAARATRPGAQVVVHVDADVLADDTAAGRAYLEGGPALSPPRPADGLRGDRRDHARTRPRGPRRRPQPPAGHPRPTPRAAAPRRRLRPPGCTETRIERLHAHHLRHWLHGGRTDLTNLVLLCDTCHGLAHDLDLVMTRRDGQPGRHHPRRPPRLGTPPTPPSPTASSAPQRGSPTDDWPEFVGVHPIDTVRGRRPPRRADVPADASPYAALLTVAPGRHPQHGRPPHGTDRPDRSRHRVTRTVRRGAPPHTAIGALLSPDRRTTAARGHARQRRAHGPALRRQRAHGPPRLPSAAAQPSPALQRPRSVRTFPRERPAGD